MNAEFLIDNGVLLGYAGDASDTVTVPDGVTVIGSHGFAGCSAKRIILPNTLTAIDEYAFIKCGCLTEIRLPDSLRQIGAGAFRECDSLERVTLPPRLTELPDACFYQCLSLKELHMPDSLRRIGVRALADCSALEHLTLPRGVEEIDEYAFEYCTRLRSIALPDGLRTIARHAFYCCHELSDITIPESVTAIGCSAFYQTAYQEQAKEFLISESGILISCSSDRETVDIPEGVKVIGEMAFAYNQTARRVLLPEGVTEICSRAFEQCTALEETALPESLRHIGELAFRGCNALTLPKLPDGLEVIDRGAFDCDRLAGNADSEITERAAAAKFDERWSLLGLLLENVSRETGEILAEDSDLMTVRRTLGELKGSAEEGDDVCLMMQECIDSLDDERGRLRAANSLTPDKERSIFFRRELFARFRTAAKDGFDGVKESYSGDVGRFKQRLAEVSAHMNNMFRFCESTFGNGQEMLILVTELSADPVTARFIAEYGCDEYYRHDKELMFYERRLEIIDELKRLDSKTEEE